MKKPQKKIISVLLSAALMITVCNPAFAGAAEKNKSSEKRRDHICNPRLRRILKKHVCS